MQRAILDALDTVGAINVHDPTGYGWRWCSFCDSQGTDVEVSRIYNVRRLRVYLADTQHKTRWLHGWDNTAGLRKPLWGPTRQVPSFGPIKQKYQNRNSILLN